jgi:hypothetical protein
MLREDLLSETDLRYKNNVPHNTVVYDADSLNNIIFCLNQATNNVVAATSVFDQFFLK